MVLKWWGISSWLCHVYSWPWEWRSGVSLGRWQCEIVSVGRVIKGLKRVRLPRRVNGVRSKESWALCFCSTPGLYYLLTAPSALYSIAFIVSPWGFILGHVFNLYWACPNFNPSGSQRLMIYFYIKLQFNFSRERKNDAKKILIVAGEGLSLCW